MSCANASDGLVTAHPYLKGERLQDIKGKKGYPLGQEMMQNATEGTIRQVTYWWPRPGTDKPLQKTNFYTKVGDQICGVGYRGITWGRGTYVRLWHKADMLNALTNVRFWG